MVNLTHRLLGFSCACHGLTWADPAKLLAHFQRERMKALARRIREKQREEKS